jgi:hypothetical protein
MIINCESAYYVEILMMLGGAVHREGPALWPVFGSSMVRAFEVIGRSVSSS